MANYAQTRVAPTSKGGTSVDHDLRIRRPNYLRNNMFHNQFKNIYSNNNATKLRAEIKTYENEFKDLYKKRLGRNPQKGKASAFIEGVITLSNSINEMLENEEVSYEELNLLFKNALDNQLDKIEEITGTRPKLIEYAIHYDEKTPHLHYLCTNYDQNGRSLHHNLKTSKKLHQLQDQVGEDFKSIGFVRGEKKGFTIPLSIAQMHEKEIKSLEKEKEELKEDVEVLEKETEELKEELTTIEEELTTNKSLQMELRVEIKELQAEKKELKTTIKDKTELHEELNTLDKAIKLLREEQKTLKMSNVTLEKDKGFLELSARLLREENKILKEENEIYKDANEKEDYLENLHQGIKKALSLFEEDDSPYTNKINKTPDEIKKERSNRNRS